jgi:hypothetical protein
MDGMLSKTRHSMKSFVSSHPSGLKWQVHMAKEEFFKWQQSQGNYLLFFHGTSQGNPGVAIVGGIILDIKGNMENTFEWGLGKATKNQERYLLCSKG